MPIATYNRFVVGSSTATMIAADAAEQKKITNAGGGTLYYKNAADVDSGDSSLAAGASVTVSENSWVIGSAEINVLVEDKTGSTVEDLTISDDGVVADDLTVKGDVEIDGELNHDGSRVGFYAAAPVAQAALLTAERTDTVDGTYGAEEQAVLGNVRTRVREIETALTRLGLIAAA